MNWTEVTLPVAAGVDLKSPPEAAPPKALLRMDNGVLRTGVGVEKRAGYASHPVVSRRPDPGTPREATLWLAGLGGVNPTFPYINYPDPRHLRGAARHGDSLLAWTGDTLLVRDPADPAGKWAGRGDVQSIDDAGGFPFLRGHARLTRPKVSDRVLSSLNSAVTPTHHVTAWLEAAAIHFVVEDRTTGALVADTTLAVTATHLQLVALGTGVHAVYLTSAGDVQVASAFHGTWAWSVNWTPSPAAGVNSRFDVRRVADAVAYLVVRTDSPTIQLYALGESGTALASPFAAGVNVDLTGEPNAPDGVVAIGTAPSTGAIAVAWGAAATVRVRVLNQDATSLGAILGAGTTAPARITVEGRRVGTVSEERFVVAWDTSIGTSILIPGSATPLVSNGDAIFDVQWRQFTASGLDALTNERRRMAKLAGQAFRFDERVLCPVVTCTNLQATLAVLDLDGVSRLVAAFHRGSGDIVPSPVLPAFNYDPTQGDNGLVRPNVWFGTFREVTQRVSPYFFPPAFTLHRASRFELDLEAPLRSAEFNGVTYFTGAVPAEFDGRKVHETGFLQFPEVQSGFQALTGTLTNSGVYSWRFYACAKGPGGRITRSAAVTYGPITLTGLNASVSFNLLPAAFTSRDDSDIYYEAYRTSDGGTTFYLESNNASPPTGTAGAAFITYVGGENATTPTDTALIGRPVDPFQPSVAQPQRVPPLPPAGCEVIFAGRERLFAAGGEIPAGTLIHTDLPLDRESPNWNPAFGVVTSPTEERISGLAEMGASLLVLHENRIALVGGSGPDNLLNGFYDVPQTVVSDLGATVPDATVLTTEGVFFANSAGIFLIRPNGSVVPVGEPVDRAWLADPTCTAAVAVPRESQVRFYRAASPALVWSTDVQQWGLHTGLECLGAVLHMGGAALARADGFVLLESPELRTDAGVGFETAFRTAFLRPETPGQWNRFRRLAPLGYYRGDHTLRVRVYYDGADVPEDEFLWRPADDLAVLAAPEGSGTWGPGATWGSGGSTTPTSPDGVYRTRFRFSRQKAESVSLEFSDAGAGYPAGDTFRISLITLEVGRLAGLARQPGRTHGTGAL